MLDMGHDTAVKQVGTKLQLFGLTNQNRAAGGEVFGDVVFFDTNGSSALNGTAFLNIKEASLTHLADVKTSKNQAGHTSLKIFHDQRLQVDLTCIPEGAGLGGGGDPADAIQSLKLGPAGCFVKLENFPIIEAFGILTAAGGIFNSSDWVYEGSAKVRAVSEDSWGFDFTVYRYIAGGLTNQALR